MALKEEILNPLQEIAGFLASALFSINGETILLNNASKFDLASIGAHTVNLIISALKATKESGLGKLKQIEVQTDLGILLARWAVDDKYILGMILELQGNVALAKLELEKISQQIKKEIQGQ